MKQTSPGENSILLRGRLLADPALSHQNHQLQFFRFPLEVRRLSGAADQINVILSQQLLETLPALYCGQSLQVSGEVLTTIAAGSAASWLSPFWPAASPLPPRRRGKRTKTACSCRAPSAVPLSSAPPLWAVPSAI